MKFEMLASVEISERQPLCNGFSQISLKTGFENVQPGHFVLFEENIKSYVLGQSSENISFIVPEHIAALEKVTISKLQGKALSPPHAQLFNLVVLEDALAAGIFYIKKYRTVFKGLMILGSSCPFPFKPCPSRILINGIPNDVIAALPLLEDWGIAHRLASTQFVPGCFEGTALALAEEWEKTVSFELKGRTTHVLLPSKNATD